MFLFTQRYNFYFKLMHIWRGQGSHPCAKKKGNYILFIQNREYGRIGTFIHNARGFEPLFAIAILTIRRYVCLFRFRRHISYWTTDI